MQGIIVRTLIIALGLGLANAIVPGVVIDDTLTLIVAALLLGLVNAFIRPIVLLLTLPITIITLGLFLFIVNAAMFGLVAAMLEDFRVSGLGAALLGAIIVGLTSMLASWFIGPSGRYEVMLVKRER